MARWGRGKLRRRCIKGPGRGADAGARAVGPLTPRGRSRNVHQSRLTCGFAASCGLDRRIDTSNSHEASNSHVIWGPRYARGTNQPGGPARVTGAARPSPPRVVAATKSAEEPDRGGRGRETRAAPRFHPKLVINRWNRPGGGCVRYGRCFPVARTTPPPRRRARGLGWHRGCGSDAGAAAVASRNCNHRGAITWRHSPPSALHHASRKPWARVRDGGKTSGSNRGLPPSKFSGPARTVRSTGRLSGVAPGGASERG